MTRQGEGSKRGPRSKRKGEVYAFNDYDSTVWLLGLAIGAALSGGAARIGLSRDGGALAVGMYMGDDVSTEYIRPSEDLGEAVREISQAWNIPIAIWDDVAQVWRLP